MEKSKGDVTLRCLELRFEEKNCPNYQLLSAKRQLAINRRRPFLIMSSIACLLTFSDHSLKLRSEETVESLENPSFRAGKALLQMDLGKQLLSNLHFKVYCFKGNMQVSLDNTPIAGQSISYICNFIYKSLYLNFQDIILMCGDFQLQT